jgi:hypothetical protein
MGPAGDRYKLALTATLLGFLLANNSSGGCLSYFKRVLYTSADVQAIGQLLDVWKANQSVPVLNPIVLPFINYVQYTVPYVPVLYGT